MTAETIFRLVFIFLLVALLAMRLFFMWKVRRAGGRLLPGREAVAREGGKTVLAVRVIGFFALLAFLGMYIAGMAWIDRFLFPFPVWLRWEGALLGVLSIALWGWAQVELDAQWSAQLQLTPGHPLVTSGPYAYIRHPLYTGMCGWAIALALLTANWIFVGIAVLCLLGISWRIPREEQMMLGAFGEDYIVYMQRTGRLRPRFGKGGADDTPGDKLARVRHLQPPKDSDGLMPAQRSAYYLSRRPRLLRDFDSYVKTIRPVLGRYFGDDLDRMIVETRREYEDLIPQIPYIGGKQPFTQFLMYTGLWLAVYRTAQAHGKSLEEVGIMIYEICGAFLRAYPKFVYSLLGFMNFSAFYQNRLRTRALQSHLREFRGDYVYNFIAGHGQDFDYGVDYLECASCKFLARQGASELAPYLCPVDILYSEALGWGLQRTMTLAEGAEKCDFRFKRDGPTRVAVPRGLEGVVGSPASG